MRHVSAIVLVLLLAPLWARAQDGRPERRRVPDDSVEIYARGCLKGRVFTAVSRPEGENAMRGPDVTGRHFRLAGKKPVMADVKKFDGQLVEVEGLVLKSALASSTGVRIGGARVVIGAQGMDPNTGGSRDMRGPGAAVLDLTAVRYLSGTCPLTR